MKFSIAFALASLLSFAPAPNSQIVIAPEAAPMVAPSMPLVQGLATWYNAGRRNYSSWYTRNGVKLYIAAGPALRRHLKNTWERGMDGKRGSKWRQAWVTITSVASGMSATVRVLDWCGCHGRKNDPDDTRLADLSPNLWRAIDQHFVRRVKIRRATSSEIQAWKNRQSEIFE